MFDLASAIVVSVLACFGVRLMLIWGISLGCRQKRWDQLKSDTKQRPIFWRGTWAQPETETARQLEQARETDRSQQRKRVWDTEQSEETEWWIVLDVSPLASVDKIRRSYLAKIKETVVRCDRELRSLHKASCAVRRSARNKNPFDWPGLASCIYYNISYA
jgi:hypothetical protein